MRKLSMIIVLFDDKKLVDSTTILDASHDETTATIDSNEAPDIGATKRADFPFDPGGAIDHVVDNMQSMEIQSTRAMHGRRTTAFIVEHQFPNDFEFASDLLALSYCL